MGSNSTCNSKHRTLGFTLLELLLALGILSLMTITIAGATGRAIKTRKKVEEKVQEYSEVRDALRILQKDIELAYHARDYEKEIATELKKLKKEKSQTPNNQGAQGGNPFDPNAPNPATQFQDKNPQQQAADRPNPNRKNPETSFVGKENELLFVTRNAPSFIESTQQADFVRVGYQIASCRKPGETGNSLNCLIRRTDPFVEKNLSQINGGTILVYGVSEFKLRYFGAGKQDYVNSWSTLEPDGATYQKFPQSVEITLAIERGNPKHTISMQLIAGVRFPNNSQASTSGAAK